MRRPRPEAPYPDRVRVPERGFGWLDDALLHEQWLRELGPDAVTILVFLSLAADRRGASFFGRMRMVALTGIDLESLDTALDRLLELELVALRPWRPGGRDGVWQLLQVPRRANASRAGEALSAEQLLSRLGIKPP